MTVEREYFGWLGLSSVALSFAGIWCSLLLANAGALRIASAHVSDRPSLRQLVFLPCALRACCACFGHRCSIG